VSTIVEAVPLVDGSCHAFDVAIDALLGRKVAGKVALTVS
jgi:hypothetical protein